MFLQSKNEITHKYNTLTTKTSRFNNKHLLPINWKTIYTSTVKHIFSEREHL